jgi:hypothetical protein
MGYLPNGFNPGENDQHRTVRSRILKLRGVDAGIEWLTVEQIARLIDVTRHARDRFLVLLLWCTGMRIGEALGLRREDMHLLADSQAFGCQVKGPHVHVRRRLNSNGAWAKSRRPRAIPVTSELGVCYADYLYERSAIPQADCTEQVLVNLFREPLGQAMTYSGVKGLFDRLARRADLIARPHMICHSAATEWIRQGTDRSVVSDLLGHTCPSRPWPHMSTSTRGSRRAAVERADARRPTPGDVAMTIEMAAAVAVPRVLTMPVDRTGWISWLIENTEADWRPDEWDAANWLFTGDQKKEETAIWRCNSAGCHVAVRATRHLCRSCYEQFLESGLSREEFATVGRRAMVRSLPGERPPCSVEHAGVRCALEAATQGACTPHYARWRYLLRSGKTELALDTWLQAQAEPLPPGTPCLVGACAGSAHGRVPLCTYHRERWRRHRHETDMKGTVYEGLEDWAAVQPPWLTGFQFSLVTLPEVLCRELLFALGSATSSARPSARSRCD